MGTHHFRLPPPEIVTPPPDVRKGYIVGPDRIPCRTLVEFRPGLLLCHRDTNESGKFHVPWPVPRQGVPILATATLAERQQPYDLMVELARGRLDTLRNQLADWKTHLNLPTSPELQAKITEAQSAFAQAATRQDEPLECARLAQASLVACGEAGDIATEAYTNLLFRLRHNHTPRLPTQLACTLAGDPAKQPWSKPLREVINAARICVPWRDVAPAEGTYRWEAMDAQVNWCLAQGIVPTIGPILEFRAATLPDWLWLFQNDPQTLLDVVLDWVRQVLTRYRGKVPMWRLVGRVGTPKSLGLSEEEQIEFTARILQVARTVDPNAQSIVEFDRPWAEWLGSTQATHQLGPLHLGDYLARSDLGLGGVGLEVAPGYGPPGSHLRDLLEFSRLLDLFALLNLPLHITFAIPSGSDYDPAGNGSSVQAGQWPSPPDPSLQRRWASRWIALAIAKPFVKSVCWQAVRDDASELYPNSGLLAANGAPKPILNWLKKLRTDHLA